MSRAGAEPEQLEDRPGAAAALILFGVFLLALQDGFVKMATSEMSLWQFQLLRSTMNLILLVCAARVLWRSWPPAPKRLWAVAMRSALLGATMILFFAGAPFLSLAEMGAGLYTYPLFVAALSATFLGERVGPRRVAAILIGFCGALLILRPGAESFSPAALLPLAAGFTYAATVMSTRRFCRAEHPVTLATGVAFAFSSISLIAFAALNLAPPAPEIAAAWPYLLTTWRSSTELFGLATPAIWALGLTAVCSCLNLVANLSLTRAYQTAESSWLAPFDYAYLPFAAFWAYALAGDAPDAATLIGMTMIGGAGVFIAWRERRAAA